MPPRKQKAASIYQLKVTLKGSKPPIWRRIQVRSDTKLPQLHEILQIAMGWMDSHLHQFIAGRTFYGVPDPEFGLDGMEDESKIRLDRLLAFEKDKIVYEYDFGDGWEHDILLEKILEPDAAVHYPVCMTGKRACPPEDCGGVWGYANLLETLNDPQHEEYEDMLGWVGGEFDPAAFDLDEVNEALVQLK